MTGMDFSQLLEALSPYALHYAVLGAWVALISVVSIVACIWDKTASKTGVVAFRVPEKVLFTTLPILGGSLAMLLTMLVIRHKTKHWQMLFIPIVLVLQLAVLISVSAVLALGII